MQSVVYCTVNPKKRAGVWWRIVQCSQRGRLAAPELTPTFGEPSTPLCALAVFTGDLVSEKSSEYSPLQALRAHLRYSAYKSLLADRVWLEVLSYRRFRGVDDCAVFALKQTPCPENHVTPSDHRSEQREKLSPIRSKHAHNVLLPVGLIQLQFRVGASATLLDNGGRPHVIDPIPPRPHQQHTGIGVRCVTSFPESAECYKKVQYPKGADLP